MSGLSTTDNGYIVVSPASLTRKAAAERPWLRLLCSPYSQISPVLILGPFYKSIGHHLPFIFPFFSPLFSFVDKHLLFSFPCNEIDFWGVTRQQTTF